MEILVILMPFILLAAFFVVAVGIFVVFNSYFYPSTRFIFAILMIGLPATCFFLLNNKEFNAIVDSREKVRAAENYELNKPVLYQKMDNGCEIYIFDRRTRNPKYFTKCPNSQVTTQNTVSEGKHTRDEVITTEQK